MAPDSVHHPVRESTLVFRGKDISTAELNSGFGYVSLNALCDAFGIQRKAQRRRLRRQGGYFDPYTATVLMTTAGGPQPTLCLRADAVPLFLAGVQLAQVVDPESRELLEAFLQEAHIVLSEHFGLSERGEIQFHREAMARMVLEQEEFEARLSKKVDEEIARLRQEHEAKVQQIREVFAGLREQVRRIEAVAGPKARLTPEQLGALRRTVATLGKLLQERGVAKPYPGIYADIMELTGVSRSEDIRQEDLPGVLEFLDGQIAALRKSKPRKGADQGASSGQ